MLGPGFDNIANMTDMRKGLAVENPGLVPRVMRMLFEQVRG
jgi:hypothetical protein